MLLLYTAGVGALATTRMEFAQTTAYGVAIAEVMHFPAVRLLGPFLVNMMMIVERS